MGVPRQRWFSGQCQQPKAGAGQDQAQRMVPSLEAAMPERAKHILASRHASPHWQAREHASKRPSYVTIPLVRCFERSKQRMIPTCGAAGRRWMVAEWIQNFLAKL